MELTEEFGRGGNLSHASAADERKLLEGDVLSLTSSDPAASALLVSSQKEQEVADAEMTEPPEPPCPAYAELLEVMERATARLELPWEREKEETTCERLDEQFNRPDPVSLHSEIEKAQKNPYSAHTHGHQHVTYANVEGMLEPVYVSYMYTGPLLKRR